MRFVFVCSAVLWFCLLGCTQESIRLAIQNQERVDQVNQALHEKQRAGLVTYLFRDTIANLKAAGGLNEEQIAILNEAWNDRDLIEFWSVQHERAKAMRLIGVDGPLYAQQSTVDLLWKQITARVDRAYPAIAEILGEQAAKSALSPEEN